MAGSTPRLSRALIRRVAPALVAGLTWIGCTQDLGEVTGPNRQVSLLQQDLRPAIHVQERHTDRLMAIPGVVGTGVGLTEAGEPVIKVFTARAGVPGLPERLDGLPVAVEVTGMFVALSDPTTRFPRPVPIGVSTGHPAITAGTIGARVRDASGVVYALSNNHVYANQNDALIGDPALQPGAADGGTAPADQIGSLHAFHPIDFSGGNNTIDAAIALSSTAQLGNSTPSDDGYGTPSSATATAFVGLLVQKYGRTTRRTHGEVSEINVTVDVCYEVFFIFCVKMARFVNQIAISPGTFSGGGDSGSLIVTDDANKNPVGLLFAGSSTHTLANPIDAVLNRFNVTIDGGATVPGPDVAISGVSAPGSATLGESVPVAVTVTNVGSAAAAGPIVVTLQDETDDVTIDEQTISGGLAAGASTPLYYTWNTTGASIGGHTLTASHDYVDGNPGNDSRSTVVTVNQVPTPGAGTHIGDLDPFRSSEGSTWTAYVILQVHDATHNPVEGATVTGTWTGPGLSVDECVTDYAGECLMLSTLIRKRVGAVTFTVADVVYGTLTYEPGSNHDPDGDSDGTSITIRKP